MGGQCCQCTLKATASLQLLQAYTGPEAADLTLDTGAAPVSASPGVANASLPKGAGLPIVASLMWASPHGVPFLSALGGL